MNQHIGQGQIGDGIGVLASIIIVVIAAEGLSQAVAVIQHRGHAIEAEAVKAVLLQPEFAVREQEVKHGILAIVKAQRVPCGMLTLVVAVEVQVASAVKTAQTLNLVLHGMRMDNVHDDRQASGMSIIDEMFQFLGGAEARRRSIEA